MKRMIFVLSLAIVLLGFGASSAFALHQGYDATSGSCRSCHAVHNATGNHLYNSTPSAGAKAPSVYATVPGKVTLTSGSVAQNLCEWCHVYGTSHAVYQSGMTAAEAPATKFVLAMHEIGATTAPDKGAATFDISKNVAGLDCIDCHNALPHAANWNENVAFYVQDAGATKAEVTNAMCVRCHEANDAPNHIGTTHPLVATPSTTFGTSNYGPQQVAFVGSEDCLACHNDSRGVHAAYADISSTLATKTTDAAQTTLTITPATNTGYRFTQGGIAGNRSWNSSEYYAATVSTWTAQYAPILTGTQKVTDLECRSCHVNAAADAGVGISY